MTGLLLRVPLFVTLLGVVSIGMILPAAHAVALNMHRVSQPFFYGAILFGVLTALLGLATLDAKSTRPARDQLLTLFGTFLLLPLVLAVPFREALPDASFLNVYFEMVSSLTTTGASVFDAPGRLVGPLHLWRGMTAWFGGFLVLVAAASILAPMDLGGFEVLRPLRNTAASSPSEHFRRQVDPKERVLRISGEIFPVYLFVTVLLWVLLMTNGAQPFVALMLALATLSTSGILPGGTLSTAEVGISVEVCLFVFMLIAVSRQTLQNDFNRAFLPRLIDDREMRLMTFFVVLLPLALFFRHWIGAFEVSDEANIYVGLKALWGGFFTVLSFLTTTGFVSTDWSAARDWSGLPTPGLILAGLSIVGGGVATTAGGVKLLRVYALYKHGVREMGRLVHPNSIGSAGKLGREVRREGAFVAWIFFMLFAITVAAVMSLLAFFGLTFNETLVFAISSLSTTGPLAQVVLDGSLSYSALETGPKLVLCAAMILGRLETLAIIALFNPDFWRV